jgi:hypothetical protein
MRHLFFRQSLSTINIIPLQERSSLTMRQTLLRIPLDADWSLGFGLVPGFGFGLALVLWILLGAIWLYLNRRDLNLASLLVPGVCWLLLAFVIVNVPHWVQQGPRAEIATQSAIIDQQVKNPKLLENYLIRGQAHEAVYEYEAAAEDYQSAIDLVPERDAGYDPYRRPCDNWLPGCAAYPMTSGSVRQRHEQYGNLIIGQNRHFVIYCRQRFEG